ncbi:hypothetical protein SCLCIDRAFT_1206915 [Scleroderma citrinum Foug A]|uniref:Uncharacterized protein n=1 Tax=Scleroderma citrinum Foug A TaxID=1036808 RepID=A0A0C3EDK2_9AGAM|nr:hypothetical protein SCLCIDRAFT_1206915 [Scleroderma citrinum Foug A]
MIDLQFSRVATTRVRPPKPSRLRAFGTNKFVGLGKYMNAKHSNECSENMRRIFSDVMAARRLFVASSHPLAFGTRARKSRPNRINPWHRVITCDLCG